MNLTLRPMSELTEADLPCVVYWRASGDSMYCDIFHALAGALSSQGGVTNVGWHPVPDSPTIREALISGSVQPEQVDAVLAALKAAGYELRPIQ